VIEQGDHLLQSTHGHGGSVPDMDMDAIKNIIIKAIN
jgi:hypothetical protein